MLQALSCIPQGVAPGSGRYLAPSELFFTDFREEVRFEILPPPPGAIAAYSIRFAGERVRSRAPSDVWNF